MLCKNPYKAKIDESNGRRIIKDGELLFENIATETEKDALKQRAIQEFIDNTTVDAVDYGIYDLMKDINKKFKDEIMVKGVKWEKIEKKIPFSSPRANYMTYGGIPLGRAIQFFGEKNDFL